MTSRPTTAMEIVMNIVATAVADPNSTEAQVRAVHLAKIANSICEAGGLSHDSDPEKLHGRILREYVRRPYLFLPPDCNTEPNILMMQETEFEPDGHLIKIRQKGTGRKGTR